jgi:UDP-3-O-[3-hydroxymyristoyl] glucosamine N-acyltransferase
MDATLDDLARLVGGTVHGDGKTVIRAVNGIREAGPGEITFLANSKYLPLLASTKASAVILADGTPAPIPALSVRNPDLAFAKVAEHLSGGAQRPPAGIHASAVVSKTATIGRNVTVGAGTVIEDGASVADNAVVHAQVYVGRDAVVGPDALIYPQVVIREKCRIGARVIVHSGTVIGSDGFGYATEKGVHHKIPQVGIVVIEDDVELGANVTIDRARFGRTVIGRGSKIDNLVQIGHNVVLGQGCLLVAQAGVAGSTRLGNYVVLAGQAGVVGHLDIGDQAIVTAQTGITKDVPPKGVMSGSPAQDRRTHLKELAALSKLPEALQEIRRLRKEVEELRRKADA